MVDQNPDTHASESVSGVENALTALWEKAREASLHISTLREEKRQLQQQLHDLSEEMSILRQERDVLNERMELLLASQSSAASAVSLDEEEKRQLQYKVRSVITKIDQYLTP